MEEKLAQIDTASIKEKKIKINLKIVNIFLLVIIIGMGAYYLSSVNDLSTQGFKLQELKKRTNSLNTARKNLELKIAVKESYGDLSQRIAKLNLVAANDQQYVNRTQETVAMR